MAGPTKFNKLVDIQDVQAGLDATFGEMIRIAKKAGKVAEKEIKRTIKLIKELQRAGGVKSTKTDNKANTLINQMTVSINKLNAAKNTEIDIQKKQAAAAAKVLEAKKKNKEATKLLLEETNKIVLAYKKEREEIAGIDKQMTSWQVKINALKKDKAKLNTAIRKGTGDQRLNAQALQRIQVQLKKYTSKMREATNAQSGLTKAGLRFRDKMAGSLVRSFKTIGIAAAAAFGFRAIIRVFDNAIKIFRDFEQATANLAAVSGFTDQEMAKLTKQAKALGATTVFTASEVLSLNLELAKLGFPQKEIEGMTAATLDAASAFGTDLGETATVVGSTLRAFGLTAKDTSRVVDVMQNAFSGSALDLEKFKVAMASVAPTAKAAGLSIEKTTGILGVFISNGQQASTAGVSLRKILFELKKTGKPLAEAMAEINSATNKVTVAQELFGDRAATSALILADNLEAVDKLTESLSNSGAVQRAAAKQLDTLEGQTKLTTSAYEGMILSWEDGDGAISNVLKGLEKMKQNFFALLTVEDKQSEKTRDLKLDLGFLVGELQRATKGSEEQKDAIIELNAVYPGFLRNVDLATVSNSELATELGNVNIALDEQIAIQAKAEDASRKKAKVDDLAAIKQERTAALTKFITKNLEAQSVSVNDLEGNLEGLVKRYQENNANTEALAESTGLLTEILTLGSGRVGSVGQSYSELDEIQVALTEATDDWNVAMGVSKKAQNDVKLVAEELTSELSLLEQAYARTIFGRGRIETPVIEEAELDPKAKARAKKRADARKKARDKEKREREKAAALLKKQQEQLEDLQIAAIEDETERQIKRLRVDAQRKTDAIKGDGVVESELRIAILKGTLRKIEEIEAEAREKLSDAAKDAIIKDQEKLNKLIQDGLDKDVKEIEDAEKAKQKAIRETLKLATELSDEFFEKRDKQLSDDIDASKKRESELIALAEKGSLRDNESIAAERKKQAELEAERKRAEQAKLALQALGIVLSTYQSKIEADDPTPVKSTAKDLLTLKALAGTLIGLAEGTDYVDGKGMYKVHSGLDGYLANLNHGEMVFTDGQRKDMGSISRDEVVDRVKHPGMYLVHPAEPRLTTHDLAMVNSAPNHSKELAEQNSLLKTLISKVEGIPDNMPTMERWVKEDNTYDYLFSRLTKGGSNYITRTPIPKLGRHGRSQG